MTTLSRKMAKDFEIPTCSAENFICVSMIQIMLDSFQTVS
jgi:hypothetical protein